MEEKDLSALDSALCSDPRTIHQMPTASRKIQGGRKGRRGGVVVAETRYLGLGHY